MEEPIEYLDHKVHLTQNSNHKVGLNRNQITHSISDNVSDGSSDLKNNEFLEHEMI